MDGVENGLAGAAVAAAEAMIKLILVTTTLQQNGRSYPTKSATARKESKEVRSIIYPNSQPNN